MQNAKQRVGPALLGAAVMALAAARGWAGGDYEAPPALMVSELAPADVALTGATYRVDDEVSTDGLLATFTIRSDYGKIEARGPGMLRMRVAEVAALDRLKAMESSKVFTDSLKASASALGDAVVGVASHPVETAKAVPAGVGRFLERTARTAKTAGQKLGDVYANKEPGAPREAEEGQGLGSGSKAESSGATTQNMALATGVAAGRATRDILGYDEKRRELAKELKVDPYTTNPILTKELDSVAWSAFAGGLGVKVLASAVPGGRLIQSSAMVTDWIYEKPPGDLRVWIEKTLRTIGVDQPTIDLFLRHKAFNLTEQTMLVMALEKMEDVDGRAEVLDVAVTAEDEDQARFLALGLHMLAREHARTPVARIIDGKPICMTRAGHALVTVPLDYVCWIERTAKFANREDLQPHKPVIMIPGTFSSRARAGLKALGWELHEGVTLTP